MSEDRYLRLLACSLLFCVLAVLIVVRPSHAADGGRAGVAAAMGAEVAAFNRGDWSELWWAHTARYRAACPRPAWLALARAGRASFAGPVTLEGVRVELAGRLAVAAYRLRYRGRIVADVAGDVYRLEAGRWLDDLDGLGCR